MTPEQDRPHICRTCGHSPNVHSPACRWVYAPLGTAIVPCDCPRWELDTRALGFEVREKAAPHLRESIIAHGGEPTDRSEPYPTASWKDAPPIDPERLARAMLRASLAPQVISTPEEWARSLAAVYAREYAALGPTPAGGVCVCGGPPHRGECHFGWHKQGCRYAERSMGGSND